MKWNFNLTNKNMKEQVKSINLYFLPKELVIWEITAQFAISWDCIFEVCNAAYNVHLILGIQIVFEISVQLMVHPSQTITESLILGQKKKSIKF